MKLGFDFDGVITDGQYCDLSRIPEGSDIYEIYNSLKPYDKDMLPIWEMLCHDHDCYIITARGSGRQHKFKGSFDSVLGWMEIYSMGLPRGIFTAVNKSDKLHVLQALHIDMYVDDSPEVFEHLNETWHTQCMLMNNPGFEDNQSAKLPLCPRINSWKELAAQIAAKEAFDACLAIR